MKIWKSLGPTRLLPPTTVTPVGIVRITLLMQYDVNGNANGNFLSLKALTMLNSIEDFEANLPVN